MAGRFDVRLIDPAPAALRDALRKGRSSVNGRRKDGALELDDESIAVLVKRVGREPEGVFIPLPAAGDRETARLSLAWRTDPGGRKHVRVRGWRDRERTGDWNWPKEREERNRDLQQRPAVWHVDPEWVYEREADGERQWVCACRCGAVGTAETLGWSAGMCGPCSDRLQELGPDAVPAPYAPVLTADGFTPYEVGFRGPDRVRAQGWGKARVWDLASGRLTETADGLDTTDDADPLQTDWALSPDGTRAVFTARDSGEAQLFDMTRTGTDGGDGRYLKSFRLGRGATDRTGNWNWGQKIARFSPDGERVLFGLVLELELWHVDRDRALQQATFPAGVGDLGFTPDYERLLILGHDGWVYVGHPGVLTYVKGRFRWHVGRVTRMALSPDGKTLATAGTEGVKVWPLGRLLEGL